VPKHTEVQFHQVGIKCPFFLSHQVHHIIMQNSCTCGLEVWLLAGIALQPQSLTAMQLWNISGAVQCMVGIECARDHGTQIAQLLHTGKLNWRRNPDDFGD